MTAWSKVSQIEAGHFDAETAYASVDRHRIADDHPYIYRTIDGGKSWVNIVKGIPDGAFVNSVKEDSKQKGLLYAATELRVYVSFDNGNQWQPLELNMPVTSVRDIVVHGDDLAVATNGRGFWVLDQMTALRQIAAKGKEIDPPRPTSSPPAKPGPSTVAARMERHSRRLYGQSRRLRSQRYSGQTRRHRSHQRPGHLGRAHAAPIAHGGHASYRPQHCTATRFRRRRSPRRNSSTPRRRPSPRRNSSAPALRTTRNAAVA